MAGLQEEKLNELRKNRTPVTVFMRNGVRLTGIIQGFDLHVIIFQDKGKQHCVYKHAISTVIPNGKGK